MTRYSGPEWGPITKEVFKRGETMLKSDTDCIHCAREEGQALIKRAVADYIREIQADYWTANPHWAPWSRRMVRTMGSAL